MDIKKYFSKKAKDIDDFLKEKISELENKELKKAIEYGLFTGGKRLRPVLAIALGDILAVSENLKYFASSIEILHNASLFHDDLPIMDNDDLRRGKPTVHKKFSPAIALLAGDAMISFANEVIIASDYSETVKNALLKLLNKAWGIDGVCGGQALEIRAEEGEKVHPFEIFKRKTGALFGAVFKGIAILKDLSEKEQNDFYLIGENSGIIFQINDDLDDREDKNYNSLSYFTEDELKKEKEIIVEKTLKMIHNYKLSKFPLMEILEFIWRI